MEAAFVGMRGHGRDATERFAGARGAIGPTAQRVTSGPATLICAPRTRRCLGEPSTSCAEGGLMGGWVHSRSGRRADKEPAASGFVHSIHRGLCTLGAGGRRRMSGCRPRVAMGLVGERGVRRSRTDAAERWTAGGEEMQRAGAIRLTGRERTCILRHLCALCRSRAPMCLILCGLARTCGVSYGDECATCRER